MFFSANQVNVSRMYQNSLQNIVILKNTADNACRVGTGNATRTEVYEGGQFLVLFSFCIFYKISYSARPASRRWIATRSRTLTSRKMLFAFFRILLLRKFCFFILFRLWRPAFRRWSANKVTDFDLEKNAHRLFPYFVASQILFVFIRSLADVSAAA